MSTKTIDEARDTIIKRINELVDHANTTTKGTNELFTEVVETFRRQSIRIDNLEKQLAELVLQVNANEDT